MTDLEKRFINKIDFSPGQGPLGDCWQWLGCTAGRSSKLSKSNYGAFRFRGVMTAAHRVSYMLYVKEDLEGLSVLHKCDNPACVRPAHLFLGTQTDNMRDARIKGRLFGRYVSGSAAKGEDAGHCKLSNSDILEIRPSPDLGNWGSRVRLARKFGVAPCTISQIIHNKKWRHL